MAALPGSAPTCGNRCAPCSAERSVPGGAGGPPRRNLHGRSGRPLRKGRRTALRERLGARSVAGVERDGNPARTQLAAEVLGGSGTECWLEIGFGAGDHLLATARAHPEVVLLGAEPFRAGVAALLAQLEPGTLPGLRIHAGDARDLLDVIPDRRLGRVFLLYPDPWPKRRHAKRRFVCPDNLAALARVMRPGAELRVATDVAGHLRHVLLALHRHPDFAWTARRAQDWRAAWPDWPGTRYERKALAAGRRCFYLTFVRCRESAS